MIEFKVGDLVLIKLKGRDRSVSVPDNTAGYILREKSDGRYRVKLLHPYQFHDYLARIVIRRFNELEHMTGVKV